jgi:hypothetical protein
MIFPQGSARPQPGIHAEGIPVFALCYLKKWLNFSRKLHTSCALHKLHAIPVLSGSQSENGGTTEIPLHPVRSSSRQEYVIQFHFIALARAGSITKHAMSDQPTRSLTYVPGHRAAFHNSLSAVMYFGID